MSDIFGTQKSDGDIPTNNLDDDTAAKTSDSSRSTSNQMMKTTTRTVRDKTQSAHSTGVGDHGRWSTQRIAVYALFSAVAMAASYISISLIPGYTGSPTTPRHHLHDRRIRFRPFRRGHR